MNLRSVMTKEPACCSPETTLSEAAVLMLEHDCGAIPVVDDDGRPLGMVTDRDITCRCVAQRHDPAETKVKEIMSGPALTISEKASLESCAQSMAANQVRRMIVVDGDGFLSGVVAQADVARNERDKDAGSVLKQISQPSSNVASH